MQMVLFVIEAYIAWRLVQWSDRRRAARRLRKPRSAVVPGRVGDDAVAGWLVGHAVAHGRSGFPGDPLPGGHLGSPENLAFWGGVVEGDAEDW